MSRRRTAKKVRIQYTNELVELDAELPQWRAAAFLRRLHKHFYRDKNTVIKITPA